MTDQMLIRDNIVRGPCAVQFAAPVAAPNDGMIIRGNVITNSADPRDSGDPEVDPSAGEGQTE